MLRLCYSLVAVFIVFIASTARSDRISADTFDPIDLEQIVGAGYPRDCYDVGTGNCPAGAAPPLTGCFNPGGACAVGQCTGRTNLRCQSSWGWSTCSGDTQTNCPFDTYTCKLNRTCGPSGTTAGSAACGSNYECIP